MGGGGWGGGIFVEGGIPAVGSFFFVLFHFGFFFMEGGWGCFIFIFFLYIFVFHFSVSGVCVCGTLSVRVSEIA